ncbi:Cobyrinic acid ac-diamide synthase [Methanocaldococcus villosus KIN24-T80]|uniref:Cobyrinic acid ac-diamide synthase n=1 Tax=Methanocaldococcus villosus KIN24-T80 TaxID=1069083 RepID=N6VS97_9EURY|nr:carbon monoxide dehydrogenase accessory protein CooC [Methanocaldococcus villosus]ENN96750.1 Cobyrinic acid ac-diamide synthase [Methanocaldococcus villosus KIN24-T80]
MIIAVSGKGGVGKTAFTTLLIKALSKKTNSILVVDADPDSNLPETLGVEVEKTVGDIREELKKAIEENKDIGMSKIDYLKSKVYEILVETDNYDLLVMGRPEGSGCYCSVNNWLRQIIDELSKYYEYVVIDTEAGLEHLSRRTTQNVDTMIVITDPSKRGLGTAKRIKKLANELEVKFKDIYVVANKVKPEHEKLIEEYAKELKLNLIGKLPYNKEIAEYDLKGIPLWYLPEDNEVYKKVKEIVDKYF